MKKYFIANVGCDDKTQFVLKLSDEELKTIIKFCDENNKVADYQCKPAIRIYEYDDSKEDYYEYDENCLCKTYEAFNDIESKGE